MIETNMSSKQRDRYDFPKLIKGSPALGAFVSKNAYGNDSIDFADPAAVLELNRAILKDSYGIQGWEIPEGYLCPPIPGRTEYIRQIAEILPARTSIRALDIGVGASCIYPIIGHFEKGWNFVGTDIDPVALKSAQKIIDANPKLKNSVELRLQKSPSKIFSGVWNDGEKFDLVICNPPFHSSLEEANQGSRRKWRNMGRENAAGNNPVLNFGGQGAELWCPGGEIAFVRRMIEESTAFANRCFVFSSLVSKETNLPAIENALHKAGVEDAITLDVELGQKRTRVVAWTYLGRSRNPKRSP